MNEIYAYITDILYIELNCSLKYHLLNNSTGISTQVLNFFLNS